MHTSNDFFFEKSVDEYEKLLDQQGDNSGKNKSIELLCENPKAGYFTIEKYVTNPLFIVLFYFNFIYCHHWGK